MIGMVFGQKSTSLGGAAKMGADPVVESVSSAAEMQDQRLVFKSRAHYVMVPVVATDANGNPVHGLTKNDFTVLENGKAQPIDSFEEIVALDLREPMAVLQAKDPAAPRQASNRVLNDSRRPVVIVALDLINTPMLSQNAARDGLLGFLATGIPAKSLVQLVTISGTGVKILHDFTLDSDALAKAAREFKIRQHDSRAIEQNRKDLLSINETIEQSGNPALLRVFDVMERALEEHNMFVRENALAKTTAALDAIARTYAGVPGRKSLVWLTASLQTEKLELQSRRRYARSLETLASANIAVYPVDVRGLEGIGFSDAGVQLTWKEKGMTPSGKTDNNKTIDFLTDLDNQHFDTLDTMKQAAEATGGRAFYNSNDLAGSIRTAASDGASYYLLTYKLNSRDTRAGWRKLQVKVARANATVRARRGVYVDQSVLDPALSRKDDLQAALESPLDYTALPVTVSWDQQSVAGGKRNVTFEITLLPDAVQLQPGTNDLNWDFAFLATTDKGKESASRIQTYKAKVKPQDTAKLLESGLTYRNQFSLPAGEHSVRFVVRDNATGRMGSVHIVLKD